MTSEQGSQSLAVPIQKQKALSKPSNEIDLQALTVPPFISSEYMSDRIRNKFREFSYVTDDKGAVVEDVNGNPQLQVTKDLWATMELITQDLSLGNTNKDERYYVTYHLNLSLDMLNVLPNSFAKPSLIALQRSVVELQSSNSKGGFLRRLFNTFFQNSTVKEDAPTKRSFFGLGKKNKGE